MTASDLNAPAWPDPELRKRHMIDLLCRDYEEHWQAGHQPDIRNFLQKVDADLHQDLLPELVAAEWELRTLAGQRPTPDEYISRYPQLANLLLELEATDFQTQESTSLSATITWPQPGEEFCGYKIIRELGRGAMGTVFLAEVPVIGHQVALKILEISLRESYVAVSRFEREAKLLSKLDHPAIVPLYSYGESHGLRYLVMKAINGVSLAAIISGTEPEGFALKTIREQNHEARTELLRAIARQLTEALQAVHTAEVLHRDIKPSNILLSNSGQVFLTDFSLARIESAGFEITRSDEFVGTLRYCSPESLDGVYSKQGDIYSLGLVLFELFSLTTPFAANSRRELLNKKLSGVLPEMASHASGIPKLMLQMLQRMTAYDAADRYQSANEVLEALELSHHEKTILATPGHRQLITAVGLILLVVTAGLLLTATFQDGNSASEQRSVFKTKMANVETKTPQANSNAALEKPSTLFALGSDLRRSEPGENGWLIPERQFELPRRTAVTLVSLSEDGTHVIFVMMGASVFMGPFDAERLPIINRPYQSEIVAADQSVSGDLIMLINRDSGRPPGSNQRVADLSSAQFFIEVFNKQREKWTRISGPLFHLTHGMPNFIPGPHPNNKRKILVPEPDSPIIFHPHTAGYQHVRWPEGPLAAISCYFNEGIVALQDGRVLIFPLGYQDLEGTQAPDRTVETTVLDCQSIQLSSDGRFAIVVGRTQACIVAIKEAALLATFDVDHFENPKLACSADERWLAFFDSKQVQIFDLTVLKWHTEPQRSNSKLLMAIPMSDALLTVEQSGLVQHTPMHPEASNMAQKSPFEKISAATFSVDQRRLALATQQGQVLFLRVP
jgi:serine/threonine protein kinase